MATINKQEFEADDVQLAEFARVMGHPGRIAILKTLAERNECVCGEIVDVLPLAQATVSQHLKELKKMGLVQGRISGVKSCYCINWEGFERFTQAMQQYMDKMNQLKKVGSCC
jgi:ArsR family transcriptional regulator